MSDEQDTSVTDEELARARKLWYKTSTWTREDFEFMDAIGKRIKWDVSFTKAKP